MKRIACSLWLVVAVSTAHAAPPPDLVKELSRSIHAWDMPRAQGVLRRLKREKSVHPDLLLLEGRLHFMKGEYVKAVDLLVRAAKRYPTPVARYHLSLARRTLERTQGYRSHRTANGHFILRYKKGIDEILLPYADEVLEKAYTALTLIFSYRPQEPIRVEIYSSVDELADVSPLTRREIKTSGTIALCKYNRLMIVSPRNLVYGYAWADTLAHEFIHLLVTRKSGNKVPIWLHEGLAKFFETSWRGEKKPRLSPGSAFLLSRALAGNQLITFAQMSPSMAKLPSQEATSTAFAEVFAAVEYLVNKGGEKVVAQIVSEMGAGATDRVAVNRASGLTWKRFQQGWMQHLKSHYGKLNRKRHTHRLYFRGEDTEDAQLGQLAEDARRYTWLGDQLRLKKRFKAAVKIYEKASKLSGSSSPVIQAKLGFTYLKLGEPDRAITAIKGLASQYRRAVLLQLYMGQAYMAKGEWNQSQPYLKRVLFLNPFDREVHGALARVFRALKMDTKAQQEERVQRTWFMD